MDLENSPPPRAFHSATKVGSKMYVFGGEGEVEVEN